MSGSPSPRPTASRPGRLSRRALLRAGAIGALVLVGSALATGFTGGPLRRLLGGPGGPLATLPPGPDPGAIDPLARIAVGACLRDSAVAEVLDVIAALGPQVMLWLGDNIYADTADMAEMRAKYGLLGANPRFQRLARLAYTMPVWDDHDYGTNDGDAGWSMKEPAKEEFLRFWDVPADDPRRRQPGVCHARTFGSGERRAQVIMLDDRYSRDPYGDEPERTILGEEQWAWLAARLDEPAEIRLVCSGIQVVNDYDVAGPLREVWESWGDMPAERERLFELVRTRRVPGVILLSGDMHYCELSRLADDAAGFGYPTYDLTAGGLDQHEVTIWENLQRVGEALNDDRKFGFVEIDWDAADPVIHLQIRDGERGGAVHLDHPVRLSELRPA